MTRDPTFGGLSRPEGNNGLRVGTNDPVKRATAASGALVVALEAVLRSEQLSDVRHMIDHRLEGLPERIRWQVVTATNELVTNALDHAGRCTGLRIYERLPVVRIEVDDLSASHITSPGWDAIPHGLDIVAGLARAWGEAMRQPWTTRRERQDVSVGKTVWCEVEIDEADVARLAALDALEQLDGAGDDVEPVPVHQPAQVPTVKLVERVVAVQDDGEPWGGRPLVGSDAVDHGAHGVDRAQAGVRDEDQAVG